ncbi:hypothetical protein EST38_g12452 [Candolleomyces aberdarensis]|uniref:Uncharacterized protein n=1 Tax=Candolleomyces aberdarensis TaxID=2316362 RepID=A0A4Q2D3I4_9AGAR|nr:hypothetical protein EST38_g12452 [Candolleomyces aberdarensis]
MGQLFGEDEDATGELDAAEKEGENAQEIAALRKEATAFKIVQDALRSKNSEDAAELVFRKVFEADIRNLLSMADMWKSGSPPIPLDLGGIMNDFFVLRQGTNLRTNGASASTSKVPNPPAPVNGQTNGAVPKLKDQQTMSLKDNVLLLIDSDDHPTDGLFYILPSLLPQPARRIKPPPPPPETPQKANGKRLLPVKRADGVINLAPTPKKPKVSTTAATKAVLNSAMGKKRKAEERIRSVEARSDVWKRMG